jgi:hypothetical protein
MAAMVVTWDMEEDMGLELVVMLVVVAFTVARQVVVWALPVLMRRQLAAKATKQPHLARNEYVVI